MPRESYIRIALYFEMLKNLIPVPYGPLCRLRDSETLTEPEEQISIVDLP